MPIDTRNSEAARNAQADALTSLLDGGYLRLYGGPRPASADDPPEGKLLAELRFGTPAFEPARGGQAVATRIAQATAASETGLAVWFRTLKADGRTAVFDGSVGTSDANLVMNNNNVQVNAIVSISAFTYAVPATDRKG